MTRSLSPRAHEVMSGEEVPIFLATLDEQGRPNCVPVVTLMPYKEDTLIFGDFMLNKTRRNLQTHARVGVAMFSDKLEGWSIRGTFLGFETHGERFDFMNRTPMFRYNAYTGVRAAGLIKIEDVSEQMNVTKWTLPGRIARAKACAMFARRAAKASPCMPRQVEDKFRRVSAIRALAFKDGDGYPRAFPMLLCFSAGPNALVMADPILRRYESEIPEGSEVAVSVLTPEAISYQVKGRIQKKWAVSRVDIDECYSASPPLAGDRLDSPPTKMAVSA